MTKKKQYDLKIDEVPELDSTLTVAFQTKGHHNKHDFAVAVYAEMHEKRFEKYTVKNIEEKAKYIWAKMVPWCGGGMRILYSNEYKKGWYPVTTIKV